MLWQVNVFSVENPFAAKENSTLRVNFPDSNVGGLPIVFVKIAIFSFNEENARILIMKVVLEELKHMMVILNTLLNMNNSIFCGKNAEDVSVKIYVHKRIKE